MQLQKIVGFRPPSDYLSERNLIYASPIANNFKDRDRRNVDQEQPPASLICWRSCNEDPDCIAYVHLLDTDECYGYSHFERNARYLPMTDELPLVADSEAMFYEKTCLRGMCFSWAWLTTLVKQHLTHPHYVFYCSSRCVQRPPLGADQNSGQQFSLSWQKNHFDAGHAS